MSTTTPNLGLFKYDTSSSTDLASAFNINTALNDNWDKIDTAMAGGGLPDQTGKAGYLLTTDGSNASWGITHEIYPIITTWSNGDQWYRIYADGWCEQGSLYYKGSTIAGVIQVDFLVPFSNLNYNFTLCPLHSTQSVALSSYALFEYYLDRQTDKTFIRSASACFGFSWMAQGYTDEV